MNILQLFGASMGAALPVQYLRPNRNYQPTVDWLPFGETELYECVDDVTPDEDATYAYLENKIGDFWFPQFSPAIGEPRSDQLHKLVIRSRYTGSPSNHFLTVQLYNNGTSGLIYQNTFVDVGSSWADFEHELTAEEIAKITSYDNLTLALAWYATPTSPQAGRITQIYFQIGELP